jgi:hypothetical protein
LPRRREPPRFTNLETIECPHRIPEEGDARANRVDALRSLQHDHLMRCPA